MHYIHMNDEVSYIGVEINSISLTRPFSLARLKECRIDFKLLLKDTLDFDI